MSLHKDRISVYRSLPGISLQKINVLRVFCFAFKTFTYLNITFGYFSEALRRSFSIFQLMFVANDNIQKMYSSPEIVHVFNNIEHANTLHDVLLLEWLLCKRGLLYWDCNWYLYISICVLGMG